MAKQRSFATEATTVNDRTDGLIYPVRLWWWERRRRRLAHRMQKQGASAYDVIQALQKDVMGNPPPRG